MNELRPGDKPLTYEEIINGERREPIFVWSRGTKIFPRKKEKIFADAYLKSGSQAEAMRVVKKEFGIEIYAMEASRILREPHVEEYIKEELEKQAYWAGMTIEAWNMLMGKHISGERRLDMKDMYCMNLIAKYRGFGESTVMNFQQNINITQANGNE